MNPSGRDYSPGYPTWNEIQRGRARARAEWIANLRKGRRGLRKHR